MGVTAKTLPNERIIIMTFTEPFVGEKDLKEANKLTEQFMDQVGEPVYRIENILELDFDFGKMVSGLGAATKTVRGAMSDPNVRGLFVGEGDLSAMTAQSFAQSQYGGKETPFFNTVAAALAFARSNN